MRPMCSQQGPKTALLTLVEIKAAAEAFDRGDTNVFDAMDAIIVAVEAYKKAARSARRADAA